MNLYVGNLNYRVKESDLREVMEEYGTKGFAFIEMPDSSEASNAINALNGAEYAGRPMVVKEALPKN